MISLTLPCYFCLIVLASVHMRSQVMRDAVMEIIICSVIGEKRGSSVCVIDCKGDMGDSCLTFWSVSFICWMSCILVIFRLCVGLQWGNMCHRYTCAVVTLHSTATFTYFRFTPHCDD